VVVEAAVEAVAEVVVAEAEAVVAEAEAEAVVVAVVAPRAPAR